MILQLAGTTLILGSTLWTGAYLAAKEKYRLKELEDLERGLILLQSQINYLSAPLPEVLESISWKTEGVIGQAFLEAAERMSARDGSSAEEIWNDVWQKMFPHLFLTTEDLDALLLFGKTLGYLDKKQQESSILLLQHYIQSTLERGKKRLEKNGRLYYGMGSLSGLLLIVALL